MKYDRAKLIEAARIKIRALEAQIKPTGNGLAMAEYYTALDRERIRFADALVANAKAMRKWDVRKSREKPGTVYANWPSEPRNDAQLNNDVLNQRIKELEQGIRQLEMMHGKSVNVSNPRAYWFNEIIR